MSIFSIGAGGVTEDHLIDNSLRIDDGDSAYLSRTAGTASSNDIGTFSFWTKRGNLGVGQALFSNHSDANNRTYIVFKDGTGADALQIYGKISSSTNVELVTSQLFRDPSAWYHIVIAVDVTQVTAANRVKIYVNGNQITDFSTETYPAQNTDLPLLSKTNMNIGARFATSLGDYYDGYLAEFYFIDGTQYAASDFAKTDSTTNQWVPIDASGLTFGTNGFYQKYGSTEANTISDSSSTSWTAPAGITSVDYLVVAGGGAGASNHGGTGVGGGGAGGMLTGTLTVVPGTVYAVTVGAGGFAVTNATDGTDGEDSVFASITAAGGGGGGGGTGTAGGSGGGGSNSGSGGAGTAGQGNAGGDGAIGGGGGGGGGAGAVGADNSGNDGGNGGAGTASSITGSSVIYAGGGGASASSGSDGSGGSGGGGAGNKSGNATAGTANTGGGGGGTRSSYTSGAGGSGIVVLDDGTTVTSFTSSHSDHTITANGDVTNTRAVRKVGDSSIKFDGNGDYLSVPASSDWNRGTGNWTVEAWFQNAGGTSGTGYDNGVFPVFTVGVGWTGAFVSDWYIWYSFDSGQMSVLDVGATQYDFTQATSDWDDTDWHHIAFVRNGNDLKYYFDGTQTGSTAEVTFELFGGFHQPCLYWESTRWCRGPVCLLEAVIKMSIGLAIQQDTASCSSPHPRQCSPRTQTHYS